MLEKHRQQKKVTAEKLVQREKYRLQTEVLNTALSYTLKRAKEAKMNAKKMEVAAALEKEKLEAKANKGKKK